MKREMGDPAELEESSCEGQQKICQTNVTDEDYSSEWIVDQLCVTVGKKDLTEDFRSVLEVRESLL